MSVALLVGLTMLACGSGPMPSTSSRGKSSHMPMAEMVLSPSAFVVAPDRAQIPVDLLATGPTPAAVAGQVRADHAALETALSDTPACTLTILTYAPPVSDYSQWSSQMGITLEVDLKGLSTAMERADRLDQCRGPVLAMSTLQTEEVAGTDRKHLIRLGAHVLQVDRPQDHLPALLDHHSQQLAAVVQDGAPQLHPEDYRCVPTGAVGVGMRTFAGVELVLGLECRVEKSQPPADG